jgi:large subunit ribosomal protein L24
MKIRKGDKVKVISGKDKGKIGKVVRVYKDNGKILVEGVNIVKKHIKPDKAGEKGGFANVEKPIDVSNVMFFDEKANRPTRLGYSVVEGRKYRISKATGDVVDKK